MIHTLQQAINDGIKMSTGIQEMIKSAKAIIVTFTKRFKIKELQERLNLSNHKLITDCLISTGPREYLSFSKWSLIKNLFKSCNFWRSHSGLTTKEEVSCSKVSLVLNAILFGM